MITTFAALLMSAAQPSSGSADLDCILNRLPVAARTRIATETEQRDGNLSEEALSPLVGAVQACSAQLGWEQALAEGLTQLSVAVVLGEAAETRLGQAGISTQRIDQWFEAQNETVRTNPEMAASDTGRLVRTLMESGVPLEKVEAHGVQIGLYLGSLIMIERVERGLPPG